MSARTPNDLRRNIQKGQRPFKYKKRRLNKLTRVGRNRIRKLEKIEKRHRATFNHIITCPSCRKKLGTNQMCLTCVARRGSEQRGRNPFDI